MFVCQHLLILHTCQQARIDCIHIALVSCVVILILQNCFPSTGFFKLGNIIVWQARVKSVWEVEKLFSFVPTLCGPAFSCGLRVLSTDISFGGGKNGGVFP